MSEPIETERELDRAISALPSCLLEIPDDERYAKDLAGQVLSCPITQDTRQAIKLLIAREREAAAREARIDEINQFKALAVEQYEQFETPLAKSMIVYSNSRLAELKGTQPHEQGASGVEEVK